MKKPSIFDGFRPLIDPSHTVEMIVGGKTFILAPLHDGFVAITSDTTDGEIVDVFRVEQSTLRNSKRLALTAISHLNFLPVVGVSA